MKLFLVICINENLFKIFIQNVKSFHTLFTNSLNYYDLIELFIHINEMNNIFGVLAKKKVQFGRGSIYP